MRKVLLAALFATLLAGARRRPSGLPDHEYVPTYAADVAAIVQQHCQSCHHPGDIAPFSLMTYRDAAARAEQIKLMVKARLMPPWKPAAGCGEFEQARVLSQREIDTIVRWVDSGAPEGDRSKTPAARMFAEGWAGGRPDLVLSMPRSYTPARDRDEYRCFSIPVPSMNELHVSMIDFNPGDRGTVHHIAPFLDRTRESAKLDPDGNGFPCFGTPGLTETEPIGGWTPGSLPTPLPEGTAIVIPADSRIVLQVHYHPHNLNVIPDQTEVGLYLAKTPVRQQLRYGVVANGRFIIPAGSRDTRVDAAGTAPFDAQVVSIYPHMHLLGKSMKVEATLPDGSKRCMVDVPDYEFAWQGSYVYKQPLRLPRGTRIHVEAHYDNSADNFHNPNVPPKDVKPGDTSSDEMCVVMFGYVEE